MIRKRPATRDPNSLEVSTSWPGDWATPLVAQENAARDVASDCDTC
jgi:hypothetical protein